MSLAYRLTNKERLTEQARERAKDPSTAQNLRRQADELEQLVQRIEAVS